MPKKQTVTETAAAPKRVAKSKIPAASVVVVASKPRVSTVKHSKTVMAAPVVATTASTHEQIARIAYGYWESRAFQPGCPEQDWLRAEQEFLAKV